MYNFFSGALVGEYFIWGRGNYAPRSFCAVIRTPTPSGVPNDAVDGTGGAAADGEHRGGAGSHRRPLPRRRSEGGRCPPLRHPAQGRVGAVRCRLSTNPHGWFVPCLTNFTNVNDIFFGRVFFGGITEGMIVCGGQVGGGSSISPVGCGGPSASREDIRTLQRQCTFNTVHQCRRTL